VTHLVLPKPDDGHQLGARLQRDARKPLPLLEDLLLVRGGWLYIHISKDTVMFVGLGGCISVILYEASDPDCDW